MTTARTDEPGVVVVGGGEAGLAVCASLRQQGYAGTIKLVGDEVHRPYRRPPLSKGFLCGEVSLDSLFCRPAGAYEQQAIDCSLGTGVESIDRAGHSVQLFDGVMLPYRHLVLALGGRARRLTLPGANHPNVHYVRTIDDVVRLKENFIRGKRVLIVGGGYIGLEVASVGIKQGLHVTLVETLPRILARVTAPELSEFYENAHRMRGVDIFTGVSLKALEGDPSVEAALLSNGMRLRVDLVVVGIGIIPNTELAVAANLDVSNGILADSYTRTTDPDIYAIGDCSNYEHAFLGRRVRLESVPNTSEQARVCAAAICGNPMPSISAPWFWSDQYDLKLQMVGLSDGYDHVVIRGNIATASFLAFYLRDGMIIAADSVNRPAEFVVARKLVGERVRVATGHLTDESRSLRSFL